MDRIQQGVQLHLSRLNIIPCLEGPRLDRVLLLELGQSVPSLLERLAVSRLVLLVTKPDAEEMATTRRAAISVLQRSTAYPKESEGKAALPSHLGSCETEVREDSHVLL